MKVFSGFILGILLFFSATQSSFAASISFFEDVKDVAIWVFYEDNTRMSSDSVAKSDLFVNHCNGKNKVYIYEWDSKGFVCNSHTSSYGYDLNISQARAVLAKLPIRLHQYTVVTASLKKIPQQKWAWSAIDAAETGEVRSFAKKHKLKVGSKKECLEEPWGHNCDPVSSAYGKYAKYEKKLTLGNMVIYIVPRARVDNGLGWQLNSVVIAKKSNKYRYIGDFDGCFINKPVDIDGDNIPELMTETCENDEGTEYTYHKIYPKVKWLVGGS